MAAAAVTSLACPLRRSSRLRRTKLVDDDSENENELTPRALRALKRQRHVHIQHTPKKRRKIPPPSSPSPEPLSPLTPSPDASPSLPGHDRPPSPPPPPPLDPPLDALIPFDGFHHDLPLPPPCQPQPQLQPLELQDQFHSFPQPQLYVPPPLFVRDREINIWKLACQERVDCLLRRYGTDYIKALVRSEAHSHSPPPSSSASHTKFRLYTPASYTYSSTSWGSRSHKPFPVDDDQDDHEVAWPIDDPDWPDADVDMDDEDEDDYEDEDDSADNEAVRDGEPALNAVQVAGDTSKQPFEPPATPEAMHVDEESPTIKAATSPELPGPSRLSPPDAPRPLSPLPPLYLPPPPLTPPSLPPLSSLHVPLLSEPPRAFMGRGTPPDRRRLIEWSGSGRFSPNGMGPPLYLSPVPQRPPDAGVPMIVDPPMPPQPTHTNGEWTSFLFSMLEGDGTGVASPESAWYELGLAANGLELPLAHARPEEDSSSSTLRFALG